MVMVIVLINVLIKNFIFKHFYGDWGLEIGDCTKYTIHNPQSPIPYIKKKILVKLIISL